ncbi:MAG: DsbC family protein [Candidatus Thiodiazotropha endolucinida]
MKRTYQAALRRGLMLLPISTLFTVGPVMGEPTKQKAEIQKVREGVNKILKRGKISSVTPSKINGLYEVMVGPQLYYVSADGRYLLSGNMYDIETREDLTTPKVSHAKAEAIEAVGEANMVVFAPEKTRHTVTIFTDIDCGYCQKLHSEIKDYNDLGISVRYLMFPRAGIGSESFDKAITVLCSDDRNDAMTRSKAGEKLAKKVCDNPVEQHWALGKSLGVNGTPAIFLKSGDLLPGYIPAQRLSAILQELEKNQSQK